MSVLDIVQVAFIAVVVALGVGLIIKVLISEKKDS